VACGSAADAEVLTKACLALTPDDAVALAERLGAEVLLVLADGGDVESAGWGDLCE
jgi:thiamine biosynthesis lipoprotein ApbE